MFRSHPDFGVAQSATIAPDIDIAELAARLGSPVTWRRDGRVLSLTNFSPSLDGWDLTSGGATKEIKKSVFAYSGDASCHIYATTNPPETGSKIWRFLPLPSSARIGLEAMICEGFGGIRHDVIFTIWRPLTIATAIKAQIKIDMFNGKIYYLDAAGGYTLFYTSPLFGAGGFANEINHNFKLVVDFANGTYLRTFADDVLIEMPYIPQTFATGLAMMIFEISVAPHTAGQLVNLFIDNVIITCSEY